MDRDQDVDPYTDEAVPELSAVRPGEELDWSSIETYLRVELPAELDIAEPMTIEQFPNGSANLTYCLHFGETELVLRRPPFGTLAPGAHDMRREFKVLSRLWRDFDAAPRAFVFCDDHDVAGADFFVMERRRGEVIRGVIPESMRHFEDVGRRIGLALVARIAEFHRLDPVQCDLADLGRPDGFVARQVAGWKKRWDLVQTDEHHAGMSEIHDRLEKSLPEPQRVALVHNDFKLDNCMFEPDNPDRVSAIFDWDMTTLGDPLIDVGTLLNYWPDPSDTEDAKRFSHAGMDRMGLVTRAEVSARYGELAGLDVSKIAWYEAFGQWKTATVVQQLHHRWAVGDSTDPRMETIAEGIPGYIASARQLLDSIGA